MLTSGESRLCRFSLTGAGKAPEFTGGPDKMPSEAERMKKLQEQLEQAESRIRNLEDALRAREAMLTKIQNDPSMPRRSAGRITIPALEHGPGNADPAARARMQDALESRYLGPKGRTYFQRYPERYKRYVPPRVERDPRQRRSPFRTRYNRVEGQYFEFWDEQSQQYIKGPTMKTYEQVRAIGDRNKYAREKYFAERDARYHAAGVTLKDWNRDRQGPRWQDIEAKKRAGAALGDPYRFVPSSFRRANEVYNERMAAFDAEYKLPPTLKRDVEMTFEQTRTFVDLLKVWGVPASPQRDLKWWTDERGSLVVWKREGETWRGRLIPRSGISVDLGVTDKIPSPEQAEATLAYNSPARAEGLETARVDPPNPFEARFEEIRQRTYEESPLSARFANRTQYERFSQMVREWSLKVEDEKSGNFRHRFDAQKNLDVWKRQPDGTWMYARLTTDGVLSAPRTVRESATAEPVRTAPAPSATPAPQPSPAPAPQPSAPAETPAAPPAQDDPLRQIIEEMRRLRNA